MDTVNVLLLQTMKQADYLVCWGSGFVWGRGRDMELHCFEKFGFCFLCTGMIKSCGLIVSGGDREIAIILL